MKDKIILRHTYGEKRMTIHPRTYLTYIQQEKIVKLINKFDKENIRFNT